MRGSKSWSKIVVFWRVVVMGGWEIGANTDRMILWGKVTRYDGYWMFSSW